MNLETIYDYCLRELLQHSLVSTCYLKKVSGIPFLYIEVKEKSDSSFLLQLIDRASQKAIVGKKLTKETIYVREDKLIYVFRHRFYVPQEKMFCCGNLCEDCIRLRKKN